MTTRSALDYLTKHELKIQPKFYQEIQNRNKSFEIRQNDRDFKKGDIFKLREFNNEEFTNTPPLFGKITYISDHEQKEGFVVFSFKLLF